MKVVPPSLTLALPKGKFFRGRYLQKRNGKNNVCQGINVTIQHYYLGSDLGRAKQAGLISPFIDDLIYKKDDKTYADKKTRMTQQVTVVMGDHKIDLINAEQYDKEGVKKTKVGREFEDGPTPGFL